MTYNFRILALLGMGQVSDFISMKQSCILVQSNPNEILISLYIDISVFFVGFTDMTDI